MTKHNLPSHISWLLSHEITPPVGVPVISSNIFTVAADVGLENISGEEIHQEDFRAPPSLVPGLSVSRSVNVGQSFLRPAHPSASDSGTAFPTATDTAELASMGRLSSASKSTRPALISQQHQLATPASTTGTVTLTQGYAAHLRAQDGKSVISLYLSTLANLRQPRLYRNLPLKGALKVYQGRYKPLNRLLVCCQNQTLMGSKY